MEVSSHWLLVGIWTLTIAAALIALHNLFLWFERRGWMYYKYKKGSSGMGSAFIEMQKFVDPSAQHLEETRQEVKREHRAGDDQET